MSKFRLFSVSDTSFVDYIAFHEEMIIFIYLYVIITAQKGGTI